MTFWDHIDELRKTLVHPLLAFVVVTVVAFIFKEPIFDTILAPNSPDFMTYRIMPGYAGGAGAEGLYLNLISTELTAQLRMHMKVSFYVGLILTLPFLFYKLFRYASPALYENERRYSARIIFFFFIAFFFGILVSYFVIFPFSLRFFAGYYVSSQVSNMITLNSYIGTLLTLSILMGLCFELPVMAWLLSRLGLLKASFLKKYRRHAIVAILIAAAIITPTTDIFTLMLVSVPIILLYELSIVIVRLTERRKKNQA
ncbi:MAG: twin-arginine translocase subunit TatC [Rikenellaceae bacterium]|nr:twin-arginine translocase subunit TatC [Rikenellaceae bacterium]MCL2692737.1 twin-arginine translocase subunit TatC [Rikenellaceae bacterium]